MPKFDIAITATVDASSIEEARQITYNITNNIEEKTPIVIPDCVELSLSDDSYVLDSDIKSRVVFLHPEDVDKDFNPEEYIASRKKSS